MTQPIVFPNAEDLPDHYRKLTRLADARATCNDLGLSLAASHIFETMQQISDGLYGIRPSDPGFDYDFTDTGKPDPDIARGYLWLRKLPDVLHTAETPISFGSRRQVAWSVEDIGVTGRFILIALASDDATESLNHAAFTAAGQMAWALWSTMLCNNWAESPLGTNERICIAIMHRAAIELSSRHAKRVALRRRVGGD